jgi:aryl-alcohol dehydrogenase-like predicted oxidoreductase
LARSIPAVRQRLLAKRAQGIGLCFRPDFMQRSLEGSLRRLRTDHVDIFYLHSPTKSDLLRDDLWRRAEQWRLDGKIRALGVSCDDLAVAEYCALLPHISIVQLDVADRRRSAAALTAICRHGKTTIARGLARYYVETRHDTEDFFAALRAAAAMPAVAAVIVETSRREHLQQNVAALLRHRQTPAE